MTFDPYLDLDAGVLRNKLGITDRARLAEAEADLTTLRLADLRRTPLPGRYDLDHLRAIHHSMFQDVYDWAGALRTVSIGKGMLFCLPQHLEGFAGDIFGRLARKDHLRGLARPEFVADLTNLLADVNALHPFREGNGRTQRAFLAQMALDAGYRIRWADMVPTTNNEASYESLAGNNAPLAAMLEDLVDEIQPPTGKHSEPRPPLPQQRKGK